MWPQQTSLWILYKGEMEIYLEGVSRDFLSAFWEEAYGKFFDGSTPLQPVLHPTIHS